MTNTIKMKESEGTPNPSDYPYRAITFSGDVCLHVDPEYTYLHKNFVFSISQKGYRCTVLQRFNENTGDYEQWSHAGKSRMCNF